MTQVLTDRAKLRLRLAAAVIGGEGRTLKLDRTNFYPEMLRVLEAKTPAEREQIKELVDWLEDYENETKRQGISPKPATPARKPSPRK